MNFIANFLVLLFVIPCHGFLIDDRTQPTTKSSLSISEEHFIMLFNLLGEEKQLRLHLEKRIDLLQNELWSTQQGVTQVYHNGEIHNQTLEQQTNSIAVLEKQYNELQDKYNSLQLKFYELGNNFTSLQNNADQIENELSSVKSLQSVADLKTILNIRNDTKHMEDLLQQTTSKLDVLTTDANARKQDFVALLMKADTTEHRLDQTEKNLENTTLTFEFRLQTLDSSQNMTGHQLNSLQRQISREKNNTAVEFQRLIYESSHKVAITAYAVGGTYHAGSTIVFPTLHTTLGSNGNDVAKMGTTGEFVCQKAGIYLVSAFLLTDNNGASVVMFKNNTNIGNGFFSTNGYRQTTSLTSIEDLNLHDTIYIKVNSNTQVWGDVDSVLSILQIA